MQELIQNADDAGAREVKFCLDTRTHGSAKLPSDKLAQFQGPALLAFNSAVFTPTDFASIQRIGDSLKKDTSKGGKTGAYLLGQNLQAVVSTWQVFVAAVSNLAGSYVGSFKTSMVFILNATIKLILEAVHTRLLMLCAGRFGIGFNSIYHLTSLPSFVSADRWCCFDPQVRCI